MKYVIGIDIGTGSTKAVVVNESGTVVARTQRFYSTAHTGPGYSEQDPDDIWEAFRSCLGEMLHAKADGQISVALSSAMHGVMCVGAQGAPLSPLILWSDTRSADLAQALLASPDGPLIYHATGTPIHAMSPLCKIGWLRQNNPVLFNRTLKFISVKEYIWWKLFGVYEIDHSVASATGLLHTESCTWFQPALTWAGIKSEHLSLPVAVSLTRSGREVLDHFMIQDRDCNFTIGASDGCLAHLASFATGAGIAAMTVGTSGAVRVATETPVRHFPTMPFSYLLQERTYICGGAINNGGAVLDWAMEAFGIDEEAGPDAYGALFEKRGSVPAASDGLLFLPYLTGERAPHWDAKSCGVFFGITARHNRWNMLRASIEGVCFALYEVICMLETSGVAIHTLRVSGGFTASPGWMQLMADVTGKRVELIQTDDASALGAAYLAFSFANINFSPPPLSAVFLPRPDEREMFSRSFSLYQSIYPALRKSMHERYTLISE